MNAASIKLFHRSTNPANLVKISPIVSEIKWLIGQSIKKIKIKKTYTHQAGMLGGYMLPWT